MKLEELKEQQKKDKINRKRMQNKVITWLKDHSGEFFTEEEIQQAVNPDNKYKCGVRLRRNLWRLPIEMKTIRVEKNDMCLHEWYYGYNAFGFLNAWNIFLVAYITIGSAALWGFGFA